MGTLLENHKMYRKGYQTGYREGWFEAKERLKADMITKEKLIVNMVAMLTELKTEIEKHTMTSGVTNQGTWNECVACMSRVIQERINALKEGEDGED